MADTKHAPRAAVIGSGFGGLAAAIRLQAGGIQTTVYESRDKPGGRAYVYEDQGFVFDAGPTVITAPHIFEELFAAAGRDVKDYIELLPVQPFYRLLWEDGVVFDYTGDASAMRDQIRRLRADDVPGYDRFVDYARQVFETGYAGLAATPFLRFADMVRVAPHLVRLRADRSVYRTVSRYVKDEHVRQALSFHSLLVGGNPYETSSIYTLIHYLERNWGVSFPRGGTGALVRASSTSSRSWGRLRLETPSSASISSGRMATAAPRAPAQPPAAAFDLVSSRPAIPTPRSTATSRGARCARPNADWSMSLFVLYFSADRATTSTGASPFSSGPLSRAADNTSTADARDFSLYLRSTARPVIARLRGVLRAVASAALGHAAVGQPRVAPRCAERILAYLERVLPDLRRHVVTLRWFTPSDFVSELHAYMGSAFSCAPKLQQSAWFRPHNRDDRIPGLYIVGAGTHPGAGVPGVVNSAKATAKLVLEDFAP
jgi:phytoene desaturase